MLALFFKRSGKSITNDNRYIYIFLNYPSIYIIKPEDRT